MPAETPRGDNGDADVDADADDATTGALTPRGVIDDGTTTAAAAAAAAAAES
jgi:hypothetical protein